MADIGTLVTTLKLDSAKFATDLKQTSQKVNSFAAKSNRYMAKAQKEWAAFGNRIRSVGKVAGLTVAVGGGLYLLAKRSLEVSDNMAKTADKIGISTDALQEYRYAADRAGVEQKALDMGLQRFYRRVAEAAQGTGELKDTLSLYGIALRDSNGNLRDADTLLNDYADAIQGAESEQEKLRLAFKGFDSEGAALVNMLKNGSDGLDQMRSSAKRLGIVIDESLIRQSEESIDSITDLEYVIKANLSQTMITLAPTIGQVATDMAEWVAKNDDFIKQQVPEKIDAIVNSLGEIIDIYDSLPSGVVGPAGTGMLIAILGKSPQIGALAAAIAYIATHIDDLKWSLGELQKVEENWKLPFKPLTSYKQLKEATDLVLQNINNIAQKDLSGVKFPIPDLSGVKFPVPDYPETKDITAGVSGDNYEQVLDDILAKQTRFEKQSGQLDKDAWHKKRQEIYAWAATLESKIKDAGQWSDNIKDKLSMAVESKIDLIIPDTYKATLRDLSKEQQNVELELHKLGQNIWEQKKQDVQSWAALLKAEAQEAGTWTEEVKAKLESVKGVKLNLIDKSQADAGKQIIDDLLATQSDYEFQIRQLDRDTWEQKRQEVHQWATLFQNELQKAGTWTDEIKQHLAALGLLKIELIDTEQVEETRDDLNAIETFLMTQEESIKAAYEKRESTIKESLDKGLINEKTYAEMVTNLHARMNEDIVAANDQTFSQDLLNAMSGWAGGWSNTLNEMLWGAETTFEDIAKSFLKMITQMIIQKQIVEPLFTGLFGAGGDSTGLFGKLFGSEKGNIIAGPGISAYENMIVDKPTTFKFATGMGIMGEGDKPEGILPLTRINGDLGVKATGGNKAPNNIQYIDLTGSTFMDKKAMEKTMHIISVQSVQQYASQVVMTDYNNDQPIRAMIRGAR